MDKKKIEEIILDDVIDFFTNLDGKKKDFIRMKSFMEGAIAMEKNEKIKQQMRKTLDDLEMYVDIAKFAINLLKKQGELEKQFKEFKHETEKSHNSNLEKIVKLDKGLDKLQKKMDR